MTDITILVDIFALLPECYLNTNISGKYIESGDEETENRDYLLSETYLEELNKRLEKWANDVRNRDAVIHVEFDDFEVGKLDILFGYYQDRYKLTLQGNTLEIFSRYLTCMISAIENHILTLENHILIPEYSEDIVAKTTITLLEDILRKTNELHTGLQPTEPNETTSTISLQSQSKNHKTTASTSLMSIPAEDLSYNLAVKLIEEKSKADKNYLYRELLKKYITTIRPDRIRYYKKLIDNCYLTQVSSDHTHEMVNTQLDEIEEAFFNEANNPSISREELQPHIRQLLIKVREHNKSIEDILSTVNRDLYQFRFGDRLDLVPCLESLLFHEPNLSDTYHDTSVEWLFEIEEQFNNRLVDLRDIKLTFSELVTRQETISPLQSEVMALFEPAQEAEEEKCQAEEEKGDEASDGELSEESEASELDSDDFLRQKNILRENAQLHNAKVSDFLRIIGKWPKKILQEIIKVYENGTLLLSDDYIIEKCCDPCELGKLEDDFRKTLHQFKLARNTFTIFNTTNKKSLRGMDEVCQIFDIEPSDEAGSDHPSPVSVTDIGNS